MDARSGLDARGLFEAGTRASEVSDAPFKPDWVSPPGASVLDAMEEREMTVPAFARRMGLPSDDAEKLFEGALPITEKIAQGLESTVGSTAQFWLKMESLYRERLRDE